MSLTDVIASFSTAAADGNAAGYTVTRTALGSENSVGIFVPGSPSTFLIDASVQPYSGRGLKVLPEGVHAEDVQMILTTTLLQVVPVPDVVTIRGEAHTVFRVNGPYNLDGGTTYQAYAARQVIP